VAACPECGRDNAEDARFCNGCAAPLRDDGPADVRKTVTVLFCDLVGSTSLGHRTDPELLREIMSTFHAELRRVLEHHGGTVEKFIGDAAMAVFGIPRAHEDDALRALRAAAEIRDAVARLGHEVRCGVNTGEVVAGLGETLVTGDAVNVAARLEQAASPGEILLSEGTHALVRGTVRTEPVEPLTLKGKPEPMLAFRLIGLFDDADRRDALGARFVGRGVELGTLNEALLRAVDLLVPQLATIVGPPGIGKSRLAREVCQRSGARVLTGRCRSYGEGITYGPLSEIVAQVGEVRSLLGDDADAPLAASRIAAALGSTEAAVTSEEIAWGFRRLFETLAREQPLIVVLDDIHWADSTLLDLIEYVATFAREARLLLLCVARPDLFDLRPGWSVPKANALLVALEPLAQEETETLVRELRDLPGGAESRIVEAAEGNPLFVEQLVAMHEESPNGELEIPPTMRALLAARIDRLEPEERKVVERASIEGRQFHRGSVAALLPEQAGSVGSHLMTLVRKQLVEPDRATVPGDDGFRFTHNLIRDAAYDSIPKRLRGDLHERFAGWLQGRLGEDAPPEIVGYHLEQAYGYRVELGPDDGSAHRLAQRAAGLLATAGRRAHARGNDGATRSLLERATRMLGEDDPDLPALLVLLGSSTFEVGDAPAALETLHRARTAAAAVGQRGVELRARMDELAILRGTGTGDEAAAAAVAEAEAAIAELEERDDTESLAHAWRMLIEIGFLRSDLGLVGEASSRLLECARRIGNRRDEVWAVRGLAAAMTYGPTPVEEAITRVEQALAEFPTERAGEDHLALLYAFAGRFVEAEEAMERSRRVRMELGQEVDHAGLSLDLTWIEFLAGRPERAEGALREAAEVLERAGEQGLQASVAALLAEVLHRLGRDDEAEEWTRRSERIASAEDVEAQAGWRTVRAKVLAGRGEAEEALRLSAEGVAYIRRSDNPQMIGDCLSDRAQVLRLLGRPGQARPVLEEALAVYERKGIVPSIERTRARLAETPA